MKRHLKRNFAPRTWFIDRKARKYIVRPNPGAHAFELGLTLNTIIKDLLHYASTTKEVEKLLGRKKVLVDGKRRKDNKFIVGIFDVVSLPEIKENYRLLLDNSGRPVVSKIDEQESLIKPARINNKKTLGQDRVQVNLYDGKNIVTDKACKTGDTMLITLPDQKIREIIELKKGAFVYLIKGKYAGTSGLLQDIKGSKIIYENDRKEKIETLKEYAFALGEKKPMINVGIHHE